MGKKGVLRDGKLKGLMTHRYKNEQKEMEGTFKGGKRNR
jgi:antitoxin component YwqK of YwqJK toxin-antitoxin module